MNPIARSHIEELYKIGMDIREAESKKSGYSDGIKKILTGLYPDNAHFVFELFQNAEDAGATKVNFVLSREGLIFTHNGTRLFNKKDVDSITNIGDSSKVEDSTKIGKFGIGFKAVFAYTTTPRIFSGDYWFEICDLICPKPLETTSAKSDETRFEFPFNNPERSPEKCYTEIYQCLCNLKDNVLLFLNNITSITWEVDDLGPSWITCVPADDNIIKINIKHRGGVLSDTNWLRFQKEVNILDDDESVKSCRIAIAYSLEPGDEKKDKTPWKIVPLKHGQVSIYFPAEKETSNLRFHMHAPFASTVARDSVRSCKANDNLRDEIASLVCESLAAIRDAGMLTVNSLATFPVPSDNLSAFYEPIRNHIVRCFRTQPLTPAKNGGHFPGEIMMRGPARISEMFNDEDLALITEQEDVKWAANPPQINQRIDQFLTSLNIDTWEWKHLEDYLYTDMSEFLDLKETAWLKDLYLFLHDAMVRQDITGSLCSGWEIIRSTEGEYQMGKEYFFPSSVHASDQITFLPEELLEYTLESKQPALREFYSKIGVRVLGEREEIELILKEYYQTANLAVSHEMHLGHIVRIIRYWKTNGNEFLKLINKKHILLANGLETKLFTPDAIFMDKPFIDSGLEMLFSDKSLNLEKKKYPLWHEYSSVPDFKAFAIQLGVMDSLEIVEHKVTAMQKTSFVKSGRVTDTTLDEDYFINFLSSPDYGWHWKAGKHYLGKIPLNDSLKSVSYAVWRTMCQAEPKYLKARYIPNAARRHEEKSGPSMLVKQLRASAWIPDRDGNFCKPADMLSSTLHPDFDFNNANGWLAAIGFGENEVKKTEEYKRKAQILAETVGLSPEEAADLKEALKDLPPGKRRELIDRIKAERMTEDEPELPSSPAPNPERRETKSKEAALDAKDKEYEIKNRSVRTTNTPERKTYLKAHNSTENGHIYCQLCNCRMPFMVKNEDYFEAVEFVRSSIKEHPANSLALCPNCAAEYKHACLTQENERIDLLLGVDINLPEDEMKIPLDLPNHTSLRFTHKHMIDLRAAMLLHRENGALEQDADGKEGQESDVTDDTQDVLAPAVSAAPVLTRLQQAPDDVYVTKSGHTVDIFRRPKEHKEIVSVQSNGQKQCPYCLVAVSEKKFESHVSSRCPKRPSYPKKSATPFTTTSNTTIARTPVTTRINRCRHCGSPAMAGSDSCYSCG